MNPATLRLDALKYGLRCLDVMSRASASVALPPRPASDRFEPSVTPRPPARDGAALSLRLFAEEEDATDWVLRRTDRLVWTPPPARATAFFEAHASLPSRDDDDELVVGFPMVTFMQNAQRRVAPLISWMGARAQWYVGDKPLWRRDAARLDATLDVPTSLVLRGAELEEGPTHAPHGGLFSALFGIDGPALARVTEVGRKSASALVRATLKALRDGVEDLDGEGSVDDAPLTRDDVVALCEMAEERAAARLAVKCHPHALAMLLARGDPTSALRSELRELIDPAMGPDGPLRVYLGGKAGAPKDGPMLARGESEPTASQLRAARALEGTSDLVALRGPPGCGKTTLLHHIAAQTIVKMALGDVWSKAPTETPWPLVVTSTNNGAVDNALAPFVSSRELPVGLRVGNRRTLSEVTSIALRAALEALSLDGPTLGEARNRFEKLAVSARARLKRLRAGTTQREERAKLIVVLRARRDALVARLDKSPLALHPRLTHGMIRNAREALVAHREASGKLISMHLTCATPSIDRAKHRWSEANRRRGPTMEPVLSMLSLARPYAELDECESIEDHIEELERQRDLMVRALTIFDDAEATLTRSDDERTLANIDSQLRAEESREREEESDEPPDASLVEAALVVRDAWARTHRARLSSLLREALARVLDEPAREIKGPLSSILASLAGLFPVAGCTLLSMRGAFSLEADVIDRLVIDEAGQCAPIYAVPALFRATRALIAGDTAQLAPVYTLDDRTDARLARGLDPEATEPFRMGASAVTSAQAVAERRAAKALTLVEHFRSQPAIVALASTWSGYSLDVRTPPRSLSHLSPLLTEAVAVLHVAGRGGHAPEGVVNEAEAHRAASLVIALMRDGVSGSDIAVLTPFVGQSARIERELQRRGAASDGGVLVRTVHRLQGGERRVVIFSVAATERRHLRWLCERPHLLHVATSRAQDHLVVLLDASRARSEPMLDALTRLAR